MWITRRKIGHFVNCYVIQDIVFGWKFMKLAIMRGYRGLAWQVLYCTRNIWCVPLAISKLKMTKKKTSQVIFFTYQTYDDLLVHWTFSTRMNPSLPQSLFKDIVDRKVRWVVSQIMLHSFIESRYINFFPPILSPLMKF